MTHSSSLVYGSLVVEVDESVTNGSRKRKGGINPGRGGRSAKGGSAPGRGRGRGRGCGRKCGRWCGRKCGRGCGRWCGRGILGLKCFLVPMAFSLSPLNPFPMPWSLFILLLFSIFSPIHFLRWVSLLHCSNSTSFLDATPDHCIQPTWTPLFHVKPNCRSIAIFSTAAHWSRIQSMSTELNRGPVCPIS